MRCLCPPDNLTPRSPTSVSNWSGKPVIKSKALACWAANLISSKVASGFP